MMKLRLGRRWLLACLAFLTLSIGTVASEPPAAHAATGDLVGSVTFATDCSSGLGVGIAFDGTNLWFSCVSSTTDLYKADPTTGAILGSFTVKGGLGALAWDNSRGKLWAGTGCGPGQGGGEIYLIDPGTGVATPQFTLTGAPGCIDDGLAYDGLNDSLYWSPDGVTNIRHVTSAGEGAAATTAESPSAGRCSTRALTDAATFGWWTRPPRPLPSTSRR